MLANLVTILGNILNNPMENFSLNDTTDECRISFQLSLNLNRIICFCSLVAMGFI